MIKFGKSSCFSFAPTQIVVFLLLKDKKKAKKMITGIFGLGFFDPIMAVSWRNSVFKKWVAETPMFIVFFWGRAFWTKLSQKGKFWTPTKNKKILADNWNARFWYSWLFLVLPLFHFFLFCVFVFVFLEGLRVRWGGPKSQLTWP